MFMGIVIILIRMVKILIVLVDNSFDNNSFNSNSSNNDYNNDCDDDNVEEDYEIYD